MEKMKSINHLKARIILSLMAITCICAVALGLRRIGGSVALALPESVRRTETASISSEGGTLRFAGGAIEVVFPPQAVSESVTVKWTLLKSPVTSDQSLKIFYAFSLDAHTQGERGEENVSRYT